MHIIADSSSSRTQWVVADGDKIVEEAITSGLNPFFLSRREISHVIRLELPSSFFKRGWDHVYFYGAGCSNQEKSKIVEQSVVAQLKAPVTVESDLLGAARGLLVRESGLACILSTGANSCLYDGTKIVKSVRSGGYLLGDEGSNAYLGRHLVGDVLKGVAPAVITAKFYDYFQTTPDRVMDAVYTGSQPNRTLADYSKFLADNISHPYCHELVYKGFISFFKRNLSFYDYKSAHVAIVGSTCCMYKSIFEEASADFGVEVSKVCMSSIPGLLEYHKEGEK